MVAAVTPKNDVPFSISENSPEMITEVKVNEEVLETDKVVDQITAASTS